MATPPRKRGRPRKKRPEDTQEFWEKQLHNHRLGEHRGLSKHEVLACFFVNKRTGATVWLDEIGMHESVTQATDPIASLHSEAGADTGIALSSEWVRYLEYMDVIAEALSPKDQGAALKELFLADARSRHWQRPPEVQVPESLSPDELRRRWIDHEVDIRAVGSNRRNQVIKIVCYPLPPDEPEDLDEAEEPAGHWEGLSWFPDAPKKEDS